MKKFFTLSLSVAITFCFGVPQASAQYSGKAYISLDQNSYNVNFPLDSMAADLGTDAETLATAISSWKTNGPTGEVKGGVLLSDGSFSTDYLYTMYYNGCYYMTNENLPTKSRNEAYYFLYVYVYPNENHFTLQLGPSTNTLDNGDYSFDYIIYYGEKSVTFHVDFTYGMGNPFGEATTDFNQLNIVGSKTIFISQEYSTGYTTEQYTFDVQGMAESLGVSTESLQLYFNAVLYGRSYNWTDDILTDEVATVRTLTSAATMCYFNKGIDETCGDETELYLCPYSGAILRAYLFSYNASDETIQFTAGQMQGRMSKGENKRGSIYVIAGDKAYELVIDFTVDDGYTYSNMTSVGSDTIDITTYQGKEAGRVTIDAANIASLLGCNVSSLKLKALQNGGFATSSTASNGGYWLTKTGEVTTWGADSAAMYVTPYSSVSVSVFNYGFNDSAFEIGDTCDVSVFLTNADKYYQLVFHVIYTDVPVVLPSDYVTKASEQYEVQLIPSTSFYTLNADSLLYQTTDLNIVNITEVLGTNAPTLYTLTYRDSMEVMTKQYSCTPYPGFWMGNDGRYASVYSAGNAYGMTYAGGVITWYQIPGLQTAGAEFPGCEFFLVNEDDSTMIHYTFDVKYVNEITVQKTLVSSEDAELLVDTSIDEIAYVDIDLTDALTALGVDADDLESQTVWTVPTSDGTWTSEQWDTGFWLDADGMWLSVDDDAQRQVLLVGYTNENDGADQIFYYVSQPLQDDETYTFQIALETAESRYVFNVALKNYPASDIVKLDDAPAKGQPSETYDLTGRKVGTKNLKGLKGVYIQNGRKILLK